MNIKRQRPLSVTLIVFLLIIVTISLFFGYRTYNIVYKKNNYTYTKIDTNKVKLDIKDSIINSKLKEIDRLDSLLEIKPDTIYIPKFIYIPKVDSIKKDSN